MMVFSNNWSYNYLHKKMKLNAYNSRLIKELNVKGKVLADNIIFDFEVEKFLKIQRNHSSFLSIT